MGFAMFDLDVPVIKTNGSVLCMTKDQVAANVETPCIRCGKCIKSCPTKAICYQYGFGDKSKTEIKEN